MSRQIGPKLLPPPELVEALLSRDNFLIATHVNPDGDAIGSCLALSDALNSLGKKCVLLDKHPIPAQYLFLPGQDKFETFEAFNASGKKIADFDTLVMVDCNHPDRIGLSTKELIPAIEELKRALAGGMFTVVIDHHQTENGFGNIRWISPETAATGMLVYAAIKKMGVTITQAIAKNIYTAIVTDTGNFRFDNTNAEVFRVAAELIDYGVSSSETYENAFESYSGGRFRLFLGVIGTLWIDGNIAVSTVTTKMFEETSTAADDTEAFVSFPMLMKDIRIAMLIRELKDGTCKVSLRSKGAIDVARVAEQFNGGGHKNAAESKPVWQRQSACCSKSSGK